MSITDTTGKMAPKATAPPGTAVPLDNNKQAVDIKGYRALTDEEKAGMNKLKDAEQLVLGMLTEVGKVANVNHRSLAIAKTEMQTAFMWAIRAIARPNGE